MLYIQQTTFHSCSLRDGRSIHARENGAKKNLRAPSSLEKTFMHCRKTFQNIFPREQNIRARDFAVKYSWTDNLNKRQMPTPNPPSPLNSFLMAPSLNAVQSHYLVPPAVMSRGLEITTAVVKLYLSLFR